MNRDKLPREKEGQRKGKRDKFQPTFVPPRRIGVSERHPEGRSRPMNKGKTPQVIQNQMRTRMFKTNEQHKFVTKEQG